MFHLYHCVWLDDEEEELLIPRCVYDETNKLYQDKCKTVTDLTIKIFDRTQFLNALFKVISKFIKGVVYCFRTN